MTGEGVAQVLTSLATLIGVVGGIVVQLRGQTEAREGRAKLADKVDSNTEITKATAGKVDAVHDEVVAATGQHQILPHDG